MGYIFWRWRRPMQSSKFFNGHAYSSLPWTDTISDYIISLYSSAYTRRLISQRASDSARFTVQQHQQTIAQRVFHPVGFPLVKHRPGQNFVVGVRGFNGGMEKELDKRVSLSTTKISNISKTDQVNRKKDVGK